MRLCKIWSREYVALSLAWRRIMSGIVLDLGFDFSRTLLDYNPVYVNLTGLDFLLRVPLWTLELYSQFTLTIGGRTSPCDMGSWAVKTYEIRYWIPENAILIPAPVKDEP